MAASSKLMIEAELALRHPARAGVQAQAGRQVMIAAGSPARRWVGPCNGCSPTSRESVNKIERNWHKAGWSERIRTGISLRPPRVLPLSCWLRESRFAAVPAEIVELAKGEKHGRRPAEQEDETKRAIDQRASSRRISGERLVRKVVGIGT